MPAAARQSFSRPVFVQTISIHSSHAPRLLDRGFLPVVRALYGIDVVLRIIGDDEEMDQVDWSSLALADGLWRANQARKRIAGRLLSRWLSGLRPGEDMQQRTPGCDLMRTGPMPIQPVKRWIPVRPMPR